MTYFIFLFIAIALENYVVLYDTFFGAFSPNFANFAPVFRTYNLLKTVKPIIYQLLPRLFTNCNPNCTPNGTLEQNGCGKFNEITPKVLRSIKSLGVTHVWYTGVLEHATASKYPGIKSDNINVIKGLAGSPYSIKDYYDVDPDLAVDVNNRIQEFENLIARTHRQGLKVIIDFVPNHVARVYKSDAAPEGVEDFGVGDRTDYFFHKDNNFYYLNEEFNPQVPESDPDEPYREFPAKATGNDCFTASPSVCDWYETVKLNYGVDYSDGSTHFDPIPDTWNKMLNILLYWANKGVDGFRCDMAFMVPVEFWHWAIPQVKKAKKNILFIAELYDLNIYRQFIEYGGFDYLYDKVNLYDTLREIICNRLGAACITQCWRNVEGLEPHMLNFLENHDEQRIASQEFAGNAFLALPALVVAATLNRGAMMVYAGQELGEIADDAEGFSGLDGRTTIFDYWSVPSLRRWINGGKADFAKSLESEVTLHDYYAKVLNISKNEKAITDGLFFDLMYVNYGHLNSFRHYAYIRHYKKETILILVNFDDRLARINLVFPEHAFNFLGIKPGQYNAQELITGQLYSAHISPTKKLRVDIPPHGAVIWKILTD